MGREDVEKMKVVVRRVEDGRIEERGWRRWLAKMEL